MRIKADLVPEEFKQQYKLHDKIHNGYVYMEIRRGMYGLPQSGMLANKLLKKRLAEDGYFEPPSKYRHRCNLSLSSSKWIDVDLLRYKTSKSIN